MDYLNLAEHIYSNKKRHKPVNIPVKYSPVNTTIKHCWNLINLLSNDVYNDISSEVLPPIFYLKNTIVHALQPFNADSLQITQLLQKAIIGLKRLSEGNEELEMLSKDICFLLDNPLNPKYEQIINHLNSINSHKKIGVITPPYRICGEKWLEEWNLLFNGIQHDIHFVRTEKDLAREQWNTLIMPFGGCKLSFLNKIYKGFCSETLCIVHYTYESVKGYDGPDPNVLNINSSKQKEKTNELPINTQVISEQQELIEEKFRLILVKKSAIQLSEESEGADYYIPARLILLGSNHYIYLPSDKTEMVVSFDDDDIRDTFCRKKVSQIREGEYIVLRTGTNSDLVKFIADQRMEKNHISIESMLDWKEMLNKSLDRIGTAEFEYYLQQNGLQVPCPNYVKAWAGDMVLRPGTLDRFETLLKVIKKHGVWESELQPEELARMRWKEMLVIVNYRRQAGFSIRKALLEKLSNNLYENNNIGDELVVDLDDDEFPGASVSLLRVLDIDDRDENVIASEVGNINTIKDDVLCQS